jgi:hypothetical protein
MKESILKILVGILISGSGIAAIVAGTKTCLEGYESLTGELETEDICILDDK